MSVKWDGEEKSLRKFEIFEIARKIQTETGIKNTELKIVMGNREDYEWSLEKIKQYNIQGKCTILFSVVFGELEPVQLINWILEDKLDVRFQLQMHKYIWHPQTKGV